MTAVLWLLSTLLPHENPGCRTCERIARWTRTPIFAVWVASHCYHCGNPDPRNPRKHPHCFE